MGLNPRSIGTGAIAKGVSHEMRQLGFTQMEAYWRRLQTSEEALDALVSAIVIPETSFFRNPESFAYLRRYVLLEWRAQPRQHPLRVLSIPCSTGEEPYSIAITLLEAGLTPDRFHIDAVDISSKALVRAQQGRYEDYSFRKRALYSPERHIRQYFQADQGAYRIDARVRSQVRFHQGNLADPRCLINHAPYDVIFCRNLLIYFHQAARDLALRHLYRLLTTNGLLFVGYAETSQVDLRQFKPIRALQAFVYRKSPKQPAVGSALKTAVTSPQPSLLGILPSSSHGQSSGDTGSRQSLDWANASRPAGEAPPSPITANDPRSGGDQSALTMASDLEAIRALADGGVLATAVEQCDLYLKDHPASAAAYLLLGEIYQAQGTDDQAEIAFQKALYLNPTCEEALIHLLLLCEEKGDQASAQRLRQRLARLVSAD